MKIFVLLAFLLVTGFQALAQHFNQYCNAPFQFCLLIPGNFNRIADSPEGYGELFTAKDGSTLSIFGSANLLNETLKERFNRELATLSHDTIYTEPGQQAVLEKSESGNNDFTILLKRNSRYFLIYRKLEKNMWQNIELQFEQSQTEEYTEKAKKMTGSLR